MSSNDLLYRYIFHGRRLNATPKGYKTLSNIGLNIDSDWLAFNEGQALSVGKTTCLRVPLSNSDEAVYFKRYRYKNNLWEFFLRRGKAANELLSYQLLKKLGIPTLETLVLYENRSFGRLILTCIITKGIPNTMQLDDFYQDVLLKMPKQQAKQVFSSLNKQLIRQLKVAHNDDFFHLDLKWRNILVQQKNNEYSPIWIDCPRGIKRRFFNYHLRVADLSALSRKALDFLSPQQLYKILHSYLGKETTNKEARKLFFDIQKHLLKRAPKSLRNP